MRTSNRDETEEKKKYIRSLSQTNVMLWETIERRNVFRGIRHTLLRLKIPFTVPMNSAEITDRYCKRYGNKSIEILKESPRGCG